MPDGLFKFEDCPLKHFIRSQLWLPRCRERRDALPRRGRRYARGLKYFTFCAVGALDVLLLDREGVITRSNSDEFDTVYFFDKNSELVSETRRRIPGSNGFPADFFKILLETDDADVNVIHTTQNTRATRELEQNRAQRQRFINAFPFDVINLDVEQYIYRPREQVPGQLTSALRSILDFQKQSGADDRGRPYSLDAFTLLFTTQVGPSGLPEEYMGYLRNTCIENNLQRYTELRDLYKVKSNGRDVPTFFIEDFDGAFKLAVPKSLSELAWERDWYIDADRGIEVFQFDRQWSGGTYRMLHLAMTLRRQDPPRDKRLAGQPPADAEAAYRAVVTRIFADPVVTVEDRVAAMKDTIEADLAALFAHREHVMRQSDGNGT